MWCPAGALLYLTVAGPARRETGALPPRLLAGPVGHKAAAAQPGPPHDDDWGPVTSVKKHFFSLNFLVLVEA